MVDTEPRPVTARIYQFPRRGVVGAARPPAPLATPWRSDAVVVETGAWYHEAAVREGGPAGKR